jgi:hypothetical protein
VGIGYRGGYNRQRNKAYEVVQWDDFMWIVGCECFMKAIYCTCCKLAMQDIAWLPCDNDGNSIPLANWGLGQHMASNTYKIDASRNDVEQ